MKSEVPKTEVVEEEVVLSVVSTVKEVIVKVLLTFPAESETVILQFE